MTQDSIHLTYKLPFQDLPPKINLKNTLSYLDHQLTFTYNLRKEIRISDSKNSGTNCMHSTYKQDYLITSKFIRI
jgi:hypothetical protein